MPLPVSAFLDFVMTIKFFAYLRDPEYAGCKELTLTENPASLRELGHVLSDRFGQTFHDEYFTPDEAEHGEKIILMVNGRRSEFLDGLNSPLKPSDTVLIFPVVAGG